MKSVFSLILVLAVVVPGFAKAMPSCEERIQDLVMEADAIVRYDEEIKAYIQTLNPKDQKAVTAEFQEDLDLRVHELEVDHKQLSLDCVK